MNIHKLTALTAAIALIAICTVSCKKKDKNDDGKSEPVTDIYGNIEDETVETYPDYPISYPIIEKKDTGDVYEAEDAKLSKGLKIVSNPKEETTDKDGNKVKSEAATQPTTKFDPTVKPEPTSIVTPKIVSILVS